MPHNRIILVVDDEETDRSEAVGALEGAGFQVVAAETCGEAIPLFDAMPGIFFLVADVALPDGNGCALAIAARQQIPDLKVLFVSGHVGSEVCRYYGLDVTNRHFLRKPFVPAELVSRVREVITSEEPFPALYVPKNSSAA
jgi:DNA-binding response OmpR family regulator